MNFIRVGDFIINLNHLVWCGLSNNQTGGVCLWYRFQNQTNDFFQHFPDLQTASLELNRIDQLIRTMIMNQGQR